VSTSLCAISVACIGPIRGRGITRCERHCDSLTAEPAIQPLTFQSLALRVVLTQSRLKPERVAENERLAAAVFEALKQQQPPGLRYATFRLADGVSFMHIVSHEEADGVNALTELPAFKAFAEGVRERCEVPPIRVELTEIGSYGFFDR